MKISDKVLADLIYALKGYKANGINDPWLLSDGSIVEPLDTLVELQQLRKRIKNARPKETAFTHDFLNTEELAIYNRGYECAKKDILGGLE